MEESYNVVCGGVCFIIESAGIYHKRERKQVVQVAVWAKGEFNKKQCRLASVLVGGIDIG